MPTINLNLCLLIESFGGWETNSKILEKVYTHTQKADEVIKLFDLNLT